MDTALPKNTPLPFFTQRDRDELATEAGDDTDRQHTHEGRPRHRKEHHSRTTAAEHAAVLGQDETRERLSEADSGERRS